MKNPRMLVLLSILAFGYAFLYVPILLLIVYSFNESRLVTLWAGFSTKWYGELFHNEALLEAAWLSLRIAVVAATGSVVLATFSAFVLVRFKRFRGRTLFSALVAAPLVMPEVITGISTLLMFVTLENLIGWPNGRGATTIALAHMTFAMAFATVVIQSRLSQFDRSLEEAAMDLGARPLKVFFVITLPIIAPAILAAWLLSFTLSLDDLVITSFVSGPTSTTLPQLIYSSVRMGVSPQINALATIVVSIVTILILIVGRITSRQELTRQKEAQAAAQAD